MKDEIFVILLLLFFLIRPTIYLLCFFYAGIYALAWIFLTQPAANLLFCSYLNIKSENIQLIFSENVITAAAEIKCFKSDHKALFMGLDAVISIFPAAFIQYYCILTGQCNMLFEIVPFIGPTFLYRLYLILIVSVSLYIYLHTVPAKNPCDEKWKENILRNISYYNRKAGFDILLSNLKTETRQELNRDLNGFIRCNQKSLLIQDYQVKKRMLNEICEIIRVKIPKINYQQKYRADLISGLSALSAIIMEEIDLWEGNREYTLETIEKYITLSEMESLKAQFNFNHPFQDEMGFSEHLDETVHAFHNSGLSSEVLQKIFDDLYIRIRAHGKLDKAVFHKFERAYSRFRLFENYREDEERFQEKKEEFKEKKEKYREKTKRRARPETSAEIILNKACNRLGVSPDASLEEIKKKYRELAKNLHPDHFQSVSEPEEVKYRRTEEFRLANEAYETLKKARSKR